MISILICLLGIEELYAMMFDEADAELLMRLTKCTCERGDSVWCMRPLSFRQPRSMYTINDCLNVSGSATKESALSAACEEKGARPSLNGRANATLPLLVFLYLLHKQFFTAVYRNVEMTHRFQ